MAWQRVWCKFISLLWCKSLRMHSYRDIVDTKYLILLRDSRTIWWITNTAEIPDPSLLLLFLKGLASSLYNTLSCWQLASLSCSNLFLLEFPEREGCVTPKASQILFESLQWLLISHRIRQRESCLCSSGARTQSLHMLSKRYHWGTVTQQSILSRWMTYGREIWVITFQLCLKFYDLYFMSHIY